MQLLRTFLRRLLLVLLALYAVAVLGLAYLRFFPPLVTVVQLQRMAESVGHGQWPTRRARWVALGTLPAHVPHAVVASEDTRFYQHHGFDWVEIHHALDDAADGDRSRGASTITQQLVKNLYLTTYHSWLRKGAELALTPAAELILPKQRILELYLNVVEWGPGVYGVDEGAHYHYGVPARSLTRSQAARLAAVLPAPRTRRPERMGWYSGIVLARMHAMGW